MFSNSLVSFERFTPCSNILYALSSGLRPVYSLVHFEEFAPCSQIPKSLSSGLLLVLKFFAVFRGQLLVPRIPSTFRAVCALFSSSLVSFERFAPCSQILYSLSSGLLPFSNSLVGFFFFEQFAPSFRAICPLFPIRYSLSSGLPPVLKFPSPFRAVCTLSSNSQHPSPLRWPGIPLILV